MKSRRLIALSQPSGIGIVGVKLADWK